MAENVKKPLAKLPMLFAICGLNRVGVYGSSVGLETFGGGPGTSVPEGLGWFAFIICAVALVPGRRSRRTRSSNMPRS